MSRAPEAPADAGMEEQVARLQQLLSQLESVGDAAARQAARELVQVVLDLHRLGLADLLAILREAGTQPADSVLPRLAVNPAVRGLLLLHDLHPEDLASRARQAVERLRPHLGVQGVRAELIAVEDDVVRIRVTATGQKNHRPSRTQLKQEIEAAVVELAPDAAEIAFEGLEDTAGASEAYVPLSAILRGGNGAAGKPSAASGAKARTVRAQ